MPNKESGGRYEFKRLPEILGLDDIQSSLADINSLDTNEFKPKKNKLFRRRSATNADQLMVPSSPTLNNFGRTAPGFNESTVSHLVDYDYGFQYFDLVKKLRDDFIKLNEIKIFYDDVEMKLSK